MKYKIEKYDREKHQILLQSYLENLEDSFEYIPFAFSIDFINILSQFKNFFVVLDGDNIINFGYENKIKNHFGFLFETPKQEYKFLSSARTVASIWVPAKKQLETPEKKVIKFDEVVINTKESLELKAISFSRLRKKINKIRRDYPDLIVEEFDKKNISKKELEEFYNEWESVTKSRKSPYMFLYHNYIKFIYENGGLLKGIIAKHDGKIIGVSFFILSPKGKQAIGLSCNGLHIYKGLNELLAYERYKLLWEKYGVKFVNTGPCGPGEVVAIKEKFEAFKEKFLIVILKGEELENEYFWYNDALDPDDFNQGQYD